VEPSVDRRHQRGAQHREAIVAAAADLLARTRSVQLSADVLAERAGVSRRTVFNHFPSLDDVVTEVVARSIGQAVDEIDAAVRRVAVDDTLDDTFTRMAAVFEAADLTPQMAFLWSVLSVDDALPQRYGHLIDDAFQRLRDLLVASALAQEQPDEGDQDTFGLELLVTSLMNGTAFVAQRWCEQTKGVVDDDTRALWFSLVARMTDQLGRGYRHP
jgi:AcrR family transcriptional regulator